MSREVFIHNSRIVKKSLSLADVIGSENYTVSYLDEYMRFTPQEDDSCFTVLFNNDSIGRGVQIVEADNNSFHLAVILPCTEEDVKMLYKVSRRIAVLWKSNHIIVEDMRVEISEIEKVEEHDIAMNKGLLADAPNVFGDEFVTLYCALLPICIPVSQLQAYSEDYQGFSKYLDDRQGIDAFFACPHYYSINGEIVSIYVGMYDEVFILPNHPEMSFWKDGALVQCKRALLSISDVFPDEKISEMDYQTFVNRLPKEKVSVFDCQHMLVSNLSQQDCQLIFRG